MAAGGEAKGRLRGGFSTAAGRAGRFFHLPRRGQLDAESGAKPLPMDDGTWGQASYEDSPSSSMWELSHKTGDTHTSTGAAGAGSGGCACTSSPCFVWLCGALLLCLQVAAGAGCAHLWRFPEQHRLRKEADILDQENILLRGQNEQLEHRIRKALTDQVDGQPFKTITGTGEHEFPEEYGKVKEKTIWSYWYDPVDCPSSDNCKLPPVVELCLKSVEKNQGDFDHRLVHMDEVGKYVSKFELPVRWEILDARLQKDALMNALMARYGGVALDISTVLLRPLDKMWDEMVTAGAMFRGYMYRINGKPWHVAESSVPWFLMARREGIFSAAVRSQVIGMGDHNNTAAYSERYHALGDQTLVPLLSMFDYNLPRCLDDETVSNRSKCPEHEGPPWWEGLSGPPRNDTRVMLEDPRDGPHLPMALQGMEWWSVSNGTLPWVAPCDECVSMRSCWESIFLSRYGRNLHFVKLFLNRGKVSAQKRSMEDILADKESFFYNWLKMAGVPEAGGGGGEEDGSKPQSGGDGADESEANDNGEEAQPPDAGDGTVSVEMAAAMPTVG